MENKIKNYKDVLSKEEIIFIGLLIRKFKDNEITYQEFKQNLNDKGIELKPLMYDFTTTKMTIKKAEKLKERIKTENFIPSDLYGYYISSKTYDNILIHYDRTMIEILAEYSDEQSIKTLYSIIKWETAHTFDYNRKKELIRNLKNIKSEVFDKH